MVELILFITALIATKYRITGGEYFGLYQQGKMEILSPSQRNALVVNEGTIEDKIDAARETFKKDITWDIAGSPAILSIATPKRLSDAHIDLEVVNSVFQPTTGFAVCEANTTVINKDPIEFKSNVVSYISEGKVVVDREKKYKFEMNDINKQVFVEFTYSTIHDEAILTAYVNIHKFMIKIMKHMQNIKDSRKLIIVYRFHVASDGTLNEVIEEIAKVESDTICMVAFANYKQTSQKIQVPKTSTTLYMDEFITFDDVFMQVEHSENGKSHKSNIIEFIIRAMRYFDSSTNINVKVDRDMKTFFDAKKRINELCRNRKCEELYDRINNYQPRLTLRGKPYRQDQINLERWRNDIAEYEAAIKPYADIISAIEFKNLMPMQMVKLFILQLQYEYQNFKLVSSKPITSQSAIYKAWDDFALQYLM